MSCTQKRIKLLLLLLLNLLIDFIFLILQKKLLWEDGTIVTYKNIYQSQMLVTVYECWYVDWGIPQVPKKCVNLLGLKNQASKFFYPDVADNKTCVMMLTSNLAEPQWIYVNCEIPYLIDVICLIEPSKIDKSKYDSKYKLSNHTDILNMVNRKYCSLERILIGKKCYLFVWYTFRRYSGMMLTQLCKIYQTTSAVYNSIDTFETVFNAIASRFPPILKDQNTMVFKRFIYSRYIDWYDYEEDLIPQDEAEGFHVCEDKKQSKAKGGVLFKCKDGKYISTLYLCDGKDECRLDGSDETYYLCQSSDEKQISRSKNTGFRMSCGPLFYEAMDGSCQKYLIFHGDKSGKSSVNSYCKSAHQKWKNDSFSNCWAEEEHEQALVFLLQNETFPLCFNKYEIPCLEGYQGCFNITDICMYKLNEYSHLIPCWNGGHLQNCKLFECNAKFKCPNSYCISWAFVCDGKWDCPEGVDEDKEFFCHSYMRCLGMFRCHDTNVCILLQNVCDGHDECILGDDELFCELKDTLCPSNCQCILFAISCSNVWISQNMHVYISIKFWKVFVIDVIQFVEHCQNVIYLQILNSQLTSPCHIEYPKKLKILDFARNFFKLISKLCFSSLTDLEILMVDQNLITHLHANSFVDTGRLYLLNISHNLLKYFPADIFNVPHSIKMLSLRNNQFSMIDHNAFVNLKVDFIETDDYHICCLVDASYKCNAKKPWYKSCTNLLPDSKTELCFIIISLLLTIVNLLSIIIHNIKPKNSFSITVVSLNIKDTLCAVYFKIIWISHFYLLNTFTVKEEIWRSGLKCFAVFGIVLWFTLLTQILLIFLSLLRLMVVIKPLNTKFKDKSLVTKWLFVIFIVSLIFTSVITVTVKLRSNSLPFYLCFPFIDPTNSIKSIKIITWMAVVTQFVTSVTILLINMLLIYQLFQSPKDIGHSKSNLKASMVIQLILLTVFNFICWFPMNGIYISAMFLSSYPTKMIIWSVLFVMPLNSFFNPLLFLIFSLKQNIAKKSSDDKMDGLRK